MAERSRSFGPVVLLGLAGAGVVAMAGNETWVGACPGQPFTPGTNDAPGATAVALALLAAWGVLLVTRGRFRRLVSFVVALLALGLVAAAVAAIQSVDNAVLDNLPAGASRCTDAPLEGWFWVAVGALPIAVVPALLAAWLVSSWPEMGRKYDAPADTAPSPGQERLSPPEERENLDLWKAIDEGRDPTA